VGGSRVHEATWSDTNHFLAETEVRSSVRHKKRAHTVDQLANLRASLRHFEQSPDFGEGKAVDFIRRHLQVRIREAEGALRCPPWMQVRVEVEAA
jgi:hypothetical protein